MLERVNIPSSIGTDCVIVATTLKAMNNVQEVMSDLIWEGKEKLMALLGRCIL